MSVPVTTIYCVWPSVAAQVTGFSTHCALCRASA